MHMPRLYRHFEKHSNKMAQPAAILFILYLMFWKVETWAAMFLAMGVPALQKNTPVATGNHTFLCCPTEAVDWVCDVRWHGFQFPRFTPCA